ncbi:MAG TPA: hypothetical protein VF867_13310 [Arthrobacter sp.]
MNSEGPVSPPHHTAPVAGQGQPYPLYGYAPKPKSSGLRIATGVVALVIAAYGLILAAARLFTPTRLLGSSTPYIGWMNFFLIVGVLGCLVTGIVILANQRRKGGATPWLVGSFAVLIVLACLGLNADPHNGTPGGQAILIPFALAVAILATLVIVLEKKR